VEYPFKTAVNQRQSQKLVGFSISSLLIEAEESPVIPQ